MSGPHHDVAEGASEARPAGVARSMRGMTGFGRGEVTVGEVRLVVDVRTVNHKGLDLKVRLPRELAQHEHAVVRAVRAALQRGRVDVSCDVETRGATRAAIDGDAVRDFVHEVRRLATDLGAGPGISEGDVLRAALQLRSSAAVTEDLGPALFEAVARALVVVDEARAHEGAALARILGERLASIERLAAELGVRAQHAPERAAERLRARLEALRGELDPSSLAHEIVVLADRLDVAEELERLAMHVALGRELLRSEEASGRKLDFLCQELLREANTAGSKLQDAQATRLVVELKSEIERLREQAQNVE